MRLFSYFSKKAKSRRFKREMAAVERTDPERALVQYAGMGDIRAVSDLLKQGVDPDALVTFDVREEVITETPLVSAALNGRLDVMKVLVRAGASVDKPTDEGWTAAHHAAACNYADILGFLARENADLNKQTYVTRHTPLHLAAMYGYALAAQILIEAGVDRTRENTAGDTPRAAICQRAEDDTGLKEYHLVGIFNLADRQDRDRAAALATALAEEREFLKKGVTREDTPVLPLLRVRQKAPLRPS